MAKSKKTQHDRDLARAASRDRKRNRGKKMKVSGKSVFVLSSLIDRIK